MLHVAPDVTLDHGAEAYLLWHATAVDVTGSRLDELPATIITQVLSNYPRLDFTASFGELLANQARQSPRVGPRTASKAASWSAWPRVPSTSPRLVPEHRSPIHAAKATPTR